LFVHRGRERVHAGGVRDVDVLDEHIDASGAGELGGLRQTFVIDIAQRERGAALCAQKNRLAADAAAGAGNDGGLSIKSVFHVDQPQIGSRAVKARGRPRVRSFVSATRRKGAEEQSGQLPADRHPRSCFLDGLARMACGSATNGR
jgi:hypothetical protein